MSDSKSDLYARLSEARSKWYEENTRKVWTALFQDIPGVRLLGFQERPKEHFRLSDIQTISAISMFNLTHAALFEWIKSNLEQRAVHGDYLLHFSRPETMQTLQWAHVDLGTNHEWVEPFWNLRTRPWRFLTLDGSRYFEIDSAEVRYEAYAYPV